MVWEFVSSVFFVSVFFQLTGFLMPSSESIEICILLFSVGAQAPLLNCGIVFLLLKKVHQSCEEVYLVCLCSFFKKHDRQGISNMCLTVIQVQLTRYVWGGPSSIDKMLLIFPGWECLRPGGQCPDSDSN